MCGKKNPKNIYNVKKWTCLGAFRIGEIQNNDKMQQDWKEEGGIQIEKSIFHIRDARSLFRFLMFITYRLR